MAPKPHRSDLTPQDLQAFAARIRAHFETPLREVAEGLALQIARTGGVRTKLLRPETTLKEILRWLEADSLEKLEVIMLIEELLGIEVPDEDVERSALITFRDLVVQIARKRGVV